VYFASSSVVYIRIVTKVEFLVITFHKQLKSTDKLVMLKRAMSLAYTGSYIQ